MALDNKIKRVGYISVDRLINQPVTDPAYVSVADYIKTITSGGTFDSKRVTPPVLAAWLEKDCNKALELVKNINVSHNNDLMYEVADIKAWANLGLHLAAKIKGAVALETYRAKGGETNKQQAVQYLQKALAYWDVVIAITRPVYNDMPLVHYSEQDGKHWKENDELRFHWEKLRPDVEKDIELAKSASINKN